MRIPLISALPRGSTGHAVGMGVALIVLGPLASFLGILIALTNQAVLFGDGGITAIGANCFKMAVAAVIPGATWRGGLALSVTYKLQSWS
jgi:cobalt/nickel transport system permease protein